MSDVEAAGGAPHRSIGEVLALLREEFPDVTISKIRFLESQGLVDPERTPSGYRKFYETDVTRLRWILQQQKDHYLPLKVIKEKLEEHGSADATLFPPDIDLGHDEPEPDPTSGTEATEGEPKGRGRSRGSSGGAKSNPSRTRKKSARRPKPLPAAEVIIADDTTPEVLGGSASGVSLTREELARASGLEVDAINRLEEFGLIAPNPHYGAHGLFDDDALAIAQIAAAFGARGIEPRHLRMYRTSAEREAVLFEQVLLPVLRLKNPEARVEARDGIVELATLGRRLRSVYLGQAARQLLAE